MNLSFFSFSVLSFVSGVAFCSVIDLGFSFGLFLILLSGVLMIIKERDLSLNKSRSFLFVILFFLFFGLGSLRCSVSNEMYNDKLLDNFIGKNISMLGIIVEEADERENHIKLIVEIFEIENLKELKTKILLTTSHYPQFKYGDEIKIIGELEKPKNFQTDNGKDFDYISYLKKDKVFYLSFFPEVEFVSEGNGNIIKEKLFTLKYLFLEKVRKTIPEPQVSLLGGLLLGSKQSLGEELQEDFRKVGLIHVVVLSGYNVSIIAGSILAFLSFLPQMIGMILGSLGIILFAIMVGGTATIIRASIMALLVILARATGRESEVIRALFLAGFLMILYNPQIVVFDPSFQLSFMATLGLICLSSKISNVFKFIPQKFYLRESATATISTQVFVLPLLLYMTGELSLVSVFVNLLVLMFIPVTMLFGFLTGVISFVSIYLSLPFSYITCFLLSYELKIVELFSNLPLASIKISYFPFWLLIIFYLIYFFVFKNFLAKEKTKFG
ncbi:MAG: ComEC/Rec2 family competence protein [Candidatus Pacebacteria bacterium]|nr:ComEC/Rec2 family competence protein [Candidatus Paceibacterota bacterium]